MDELTELFLSQEIKEEKGCWIWKGKTNKAGYGLFYDTKLEETLAHRISYSLFHNEDIYGKVIHHICENKSCINPDHLMMIYLSDHAKIHLTKRKERLLFKDEYITQEENGFSVYWSKNKNRVKLITFKNLTSAKEAVNYLLKSSYYPFIRSQFYELETAFKNLIKRKVDIALNNQTRSLNNYGTTTISKRGTPNSKG